MSIEVIALQFAVTCGMWGAAFVMLAAIGTAIFQDSTACLACFVLAGLGSLLLVVGAAAGLFSATWIIWTKGIAL